jgi:hypothetical protein
MYTYRQIDLLPDYSNIVVDRAFALIKFYMFLGRLGFENFLSPILNVEQYTDVSKRDILQSYRLYKNTNEPSAESS